MRGLARYIQLLKQCEIVAMIVYLENGYKLGKIKHFRWMFVRAQVMC